MFPIQNDFSGNSYPMPSLYTQIALTYFIFISIKRISTDILQCFFQILSRYPIRHSISGSEKFFSVSITQKYRSACPKSDFIKFFVIYHTFFQKFPDISGKKTLNLSRPDRPHLFYYCERLYLFYTNICPMSGFSTKRIPQLSPRDSVSLQYFSHNISWQLYFRMLPSQFQWFTRPHSATIVFSEFQHQVNSIIHGNRSKISGQAFSRPFNIGFP